MTPRTAPTLLNDVRLIGDRSLRSRRFRWEAIALALAANACTRPAPPTAAPVLELMVANDPETLDPRYVSDAVGLRASRLVHAGLVRLDPDSLRPTPYAAQSWHWLDPLTLEVELRSDIHFHSGAPFRAEDVVATLHAIASPAVHSRHARIVAAIAEVTAVDERTVIFRLSRPHATLLTDLELPILRADQATSPPAPDGSLDGLGPYSVARFEAGDVLLVPAGGGVLPEPHFAVSLRTVHDENARALRLEGGRADVAPNLVSPTLLPALAEYPGLHVVARQGANLTYMLVQHERPALADVRVRRALSFAIDRALITATLFAGRARPASALIAPIHWAHTDVPQLVFDPTRARELLGEAGAANLHITLLTSTDRLRGDVARFMSQEFADVGITTEVVPLELGTLIARLDAGDFDLAILNLPEMTEPNVLRYFLHSASIPPLGANRGRVRDAALDHLLDRGEACTDPQERRSIYAEVELRERKEMHWVPLFYEDQVAVTSLRADGFVPSAEGRWLSLAGLR